MEFDPALSLRHVSNTQVIFGGEDIDAKSLQSVVVNATGHCDQVLSGLSEKCTQHVLTMTIRLEAPDCACLSCIGRNQVATIFRIQRSSSSMVTPLALE